MSSLHIAIQGDGVAACCCARLLLNRGLDVTFQKATRPSLPSLLVSPSTQNLMADVFDDGNIFAGFPVIRKRIVLWRNQTVPVTLPHSGVVASESQLLQRLWGRLEMPSETLPERDNDKADWLILSSRSAVNGKARQFGSRMATAAAVQLHPRTDPEACWVEALDDGWLFLLPNSAQAGSLISVGGSLYNLIGESRLVASQVKSLQVSSQSFPAYPRILDPLCGPGWLACGTSAMSFDPICGEGAGNAIREAILVSAAVGFLAGNPDCSSVLDHYSSRLLGGFLKHLHLCRDFYSSGPDCEWWNAELRLLEKGIDWTQQKLSTLTRSNVKPAFRLVGFDLQTAG